MERKEFTGGDFRPAARHAENSRARRRYRRRRRAALLSGLALGLLLAAGLLFALRGLTGQLFGGRSYGETPPAAMGETPAPGGSVDLAAVAIPEWIDQQLLAPGGSRRGEALDPVRDVAVHYIGNPGTSAAANRNYFDSPGVEVNAHFIVGLEGEIIQCIPLDEKSSATNERNRDTISIEMCHPDESGKFNDASYNSLVKLCAWLCRELKLSEENLIRHYDVTGKECPLYFVQHEDAWAQFKADVGASLKE